MQITLYKNASENIVVNKTLNEITTMHGTLREGTSILEPSILIEISNEENYALIDDVIDNDGDEIVFNDVADILKCNYAYIHEFNRYYYINDIIVTNNKLYRINMSVDVLMSFKDTYLKLDALISRNEFTYNAKLEDDRMPYAFFTSVEEQDVEDDENDMTFDTNLQDTPVACNYVISYFAVGKLTPTDKEIDAIGLLPSISYNAVGDNVCNQINPMLKSYVNVLGTKIADNENIATFIKSLVCYPFIIPDSSTALHQLQLGKNNVDGVFTGLFKDDLVVSPYYRLGYFNKVWNSYLDVEPYTHYELYLPYYGYIDLKSSEILNCRVDIYYSFDWANGLAKINIYNTTRNYVIKSVVANIGIKISLSRSNNQQLQDEKVQIAIKTGLSTLGSLVSVGAGAVTGNPYMIAGGVTGLSNTLIDSSVQLAQMHEKGQVSNNSGIEGLYGIQTCRLKESRYYTLEPSNYAHYYGKPLNRTLKLNTLHGYTIVKDIHLENLDATRNEITELMSLLTTGIIL